MHIIFDNIQHTLSTIQHRLSLPSTNKSSSYNILSKLLIHPASLSHRFTYHGIVLARIVSHLLTPNDNIVSNSTAPNENKPNGNIVSNSIVSKYNIVSNSIALNGNVVSDSIAPIGNIVSLNIVDKHNILSSKRISYLLSSASIRHVNGIEFNFHSNLYFDVTC